MTNPHLMGINVSYRSNLDCGEDHSTGIGCPKQHKVQAEWATASNFCRVAVGEAEIVMSVSLFDALLDAMKAVRE